MNRFFLFFLIDIIYKPNIKSKSNTTHLKKLHWESRKKKKKKKVGCISLLDLHRGSQRREVTRRAVTPRDGR